MKKDWKGCWRSFYHANSTRRIEDRYDADVEGMAEEGVDSNALPKLRKGKFHSPEKFEEEMRSDAKEKWKTKRKGTRHRDVATIRKMVDNEEEEGA